MQRLALTAAVLLAAAHTAHAEPGEKDPKVALGLSLAGTALGPALIALGEHDHSDATATAGVGAMLVGPSAGEWYSGKPLTYGMAARAIGGAVLFGGFVVVLESDPIDFSDNPPPPDKAGVALGASAMVLGAAAIVGGTIYDVVDAPASAKDWNARHHVTLTPTYEHGGGGLALAGTF